MSAPRRTRFKYVDKKCSECGTTLILKSTRDISRKKYCSRACRQRGRYRCGEFAMERMWVKCNTPEANAKKGRSGENHHMWLEDRGSVKYRPRYEGSLWRRAVFERDNYTCVICGTRGAKLQADHIKPYCAYPELRWVLENGRTLCVECHKKTPTYAGRARAHMRKAEDEHAV